MDFLTIRDVAFALKVSEETVRRWIRNKKIEAENMGGRLGYRIAKKEFERLKKENKYIAVADEEIKKVKIDRDYIQSELEKIQKVLLDVDEYDKNDMSKSEALKMVADLEKIIQEIPGVSSSRLDRCQWERYNSGPKFTRKEPVLIPLEVELLKIIQENVELLIQGSEQPDILATIKFIDNAIRNKLNIRLSPRGEMDLQELVRTAMDFQEKDNQQKVTMVESYQLASCLRRIEEYIDTNHYSGVKIESKRP